MPFSAAWWNAPAFYPAPGVLSFSENLLGLSLISTPLAWLGAGPQAAYNVVFLLTFPLSAIGAYLLVLRADPTPRLCIHCRVAVRLCAVPDRASSADPVAGIVSDAVFAPGPASLPSRPAPEMACAVCRRLVPAGHLQWLLPAVFQRVRGPLDSVVCEPLDAAARVSRGERGVAGRGCGDPAVAAALSHDSRVVRLHPRLRDDSRICGRCRGGAACDQSPGALGVACTCSGAPKENCFPG